MSDLYQQLGLVSTSYAVDDPDAWVLLPNSSDPEWVALLSYCHIKSFYSHEVLCLPTQSISALYILISGRVRVEPLSRRQSPFFLGAGAVLGAVSFFDGNPIGATISSTRDGELAILTQQDLLHMQTQYPHLSQKILFNLGHLLAHRLRECDELAYH